MTSQITHKRNDFASTSQKRIHFTPKTKKSEKTKLKFDTSKYCKMDKITPDELEILARKLLNVSIENQTKNEGINSFNFIQPQQKQKHKQQSLQNSVHHKSESISFGLQLIANIKQISSNLTVLINEFVCGLNEILESCQNFIDLIIDPLPRLLHNDYIDKILEYQQFVKILDNMSSNFYDCSKNITKDLPNLSHILQSDHSQRVTEYNAYVQDFKSADNDIKTLQTHCDRTFRSLSSEIDMLSEVNTNSNSKFFCKDLLRKQCHSQTHISPHPIES